MRKIKLESLQEIVFLNESHDKFVGYTTNKHKDIFNKPYELAGIEEYYYFVTTIADSYMYVNRTKLFEILPTKEIDMINSNEIYEHGYPESRLIPSNHYTECQDMFIESVQNDISEIINEILRENICVSCEGE